MKQTIVKNVTINHEGGKVIFLEIPQNMTGQRLQNWREENEQEIQEAISTEENEPELYARVMPAL